MGVCFSRKIITEVGLFVMDVTDFIKLLMTSAILALKIFFFILMLDIVCKFCHQGVFVEVSRVV